MKRIRLTGQLAEPIGPFTDGVEAGGFLYVAGMLPSTSTETSWAPVTWSGKRNRCLTT